MWSLIHVLIPVNLCVKGVPVNAQNNHHIYDRFRVTHSPFQGELAWYFLRQGYWWNVKHAVSILWQWFGTVRLYNTITPLIVRRAGLLWSQQDFEWRWSVPLFKCLTVLEFSFILFDLCLLITFFNFIMNYVPIVTFWIFTYHKIWILSIMFCFIWNYWIIYFLACLEVSWRVVS